MQRDLLSRLKILPQRNLLRYGLNKSHFTSFPEPFEKDQKVYSIDIPPSGLIAPEMKRFNECLNRTLDIENLVLGKIVAHFVNSNSQKLRATVNLLLSKALVGDKFCDNLIIDKQIKLAQVTELIYLSERIHAGVGETEKSHLDAKGSNSLYANALAILGGDYFLTKATSLLSEIKNSRVTELFSESICEGTEGEFMQVNLRCSDGLEGLDFSARCLNEYLSKIYLCHASLFANSCKAVAILAGADEKMSELCFKAGKAFGLNYRLVNELLDSVEKENIKKHIVSRTLTSTLILASDQSAALKKLLTSSKKPQSLEVEQLDRAYDDFLDSQTVLERSRQFVRRFELEATKCFEQLPSSRYKQGLFDLLKAINRSIEF